MAFCDFTWLLFFFKKNIVFIYLFFKTPHPSFKCRCRWGHEHYWLLCESLLWLCRPTYKKSVIAEWWTDMLILTKCVRIYLCVCRGRGAAFCPVLCRRSAIAECPGMTLRAVGQSSVLCWAACPLCWKRCADRHITVTWLMYMAGFPSSLLRNCGITLKHKREKTEKKVLTPKANVHHFEKSGRYIRIAGTGDSFSTESSFLLFS